MKRGMSFLKVGLVIGLLATSFAPASAAPPPLPSSFYGVVQVNGTSVSADTVISARIGGVEYAQTRVIMQGKNSDYGIDVPGDDPDTAAKEGGVPGDKIEFYVGGWRVPRTATWASGTNAQLDLGVYRCLFPTVRR